MKKRAFFIFFLFPWLVCGQSRQADSLATYRYQDLFKANIYSDKPVAKQALDSLSYIAQQNRYPQAAYYHHFLSGDYYFNTHKLGLSEIHYRQAVELAERMGMLEDAVDSKIWLGNLGYVRKKNTEAIQWYTEAYALAEEIGYVGGMCNALSGRSGLEKDYRKKMEIYIQIESLYAQHNEISPVLANTYAHMGLLYLNTLNNPKAAVEYFEKSMYISKLVDYPYGISEANKRLGEIALREADYERAKVFFDDLYAENLTRQDTLYQAHALCQLAEVHRRMEKYSEAESNVQQAIDYYTRKNDVIALMGARLLLAQIQLETGRPHLAKPHLDYANSHYQRSYDTLGFKIKLLAAEVGYYSSLQRFAEALDKQKAVDEAKTLQNRLLSEEKFLELDAQYRTRQKEQQIELLSAENQLAEQKRKNQLAFLAIIMALMFVVGLALFSAYRNKLKTARKIRELDEMKSRFFTNISHEFRTPLTLIKCPLQQLQASLAEERQQKQLSLIGQSADRMLELVDQLLELSKLDSGHLKLMPKEGNIGLFLKSLSEPFEYQAKESGFAYFSNIEVPAANHWFDHDVIEKIVTNLLSNALKYTPENQQIRMVSTVGGNLLEINISNSIHGLERSDLPRIYERFYQSEQAKKGFGVGLALVKELVELYDGTISNSLDNDVLNFCITLSLAQEGMDQATVPNEETRSEESSGGDALDYEFPTLLLVDDNAEIRGLLQDIFSANYRVLAAENGKAALEIAQREIPDCIISDVMMPGMDGFQLTQAIKENELTSFIPVVLLTAKSTDEAHLESLKSTADAFLTKPFNNEILKETVSRQIDERRKLRERYSRELILKPVDVTINTVDEKFLDKLASVMEAHLCDASFSTDDFASELGMSRMQLHRKLKSLLNVSTTEFIRNERLKAAMALIGKGHHSVSEVAYAVGFNEVTYFSKCFKECYGVTPTEHISLHSSERETMSELK